ncbi:YqcC family protein [Endozoicomonas gorgoniicola]|uniref:YqcC family protein n=1 Tax=Endozoicomonas gorgoniicola TaxID=1234144 RepID=A0ABT3MZP6_9GAMM|nr:YqcC family protein [Endozoicomonas gorgoniicola]MCW7554856.1 YqcC family protein [Endozoicomonas gorgoniicola]
MSVQIIRLLEEMEAELKVLGCWQTMPPAPEAMSSEVPFCMDAMPFSQWLQWLFIPRVRTIVEQGGALPKGANIKPYAEEALMVEKVSSVKLLNLVEQFDVLMK